MDCVLDAKAELGEGPVWDPDAGCLYFVDIERGAVHRHDPATATSRSFQIGMMVGAAALTAAGDLVLAVSDGFARLDLDSGQVRALAAVEAYNVDTPTRSIDVFDFDVATGTIANRRSLARVEHGEGWPDGLTLDIDGYIWVALWSGAAVRRYAPDGTLDRVVAVPTMYPTSCAFGGPDLQDLYVTTAATALTPDERLREPLAGGVFRCRPGVQGRPPHRFKG